MTWSLSSLATSRTTPLIHQHGVSMNLHRQREGGDLSRIESDRVAHLRRDSRRRLLADARRQCKSREAWRGGD